MIENELTFLIKELPEDLEDYPKKKIEQGYFSDIPSPLRIRNENNEIFTLTKKSKINENDASRFNEITVSIKKEEYDILWPVCKKKLSKTRYFYPLNNLTAEIDVFHDKLKGFMMVEVEFPNEESRIKFTPPKWFGKDITQEKWAANSFLTDLTYKELLSFL